MQVTVEYAAQIKRAAGRAGEAVDVDPGASVQDLVAQIAKVHGDPLAGLLLDGGGELHPSILIFVGDQQVRWEQPRELQPGETVTFLSPISGG